MVFTTNAFAAAPILVSKQETNAGRVLAVAINSGNANACTGANGLEVARAMQRACAESLGLDPRAVAVASTGIIGVQLDAGFMATAVTKAAAALSPNGGPNFCRSIMTTDRYPKACALEVALPTGTVRLGACAKGAGMIAPAMATMLCVVTTDALLDPDQTKELLAKAVAASFNRVTVDGEMSTNDAVFFLASGASGVQPDSAGMEILRAALETLLLRIALMMVADGEGATKIIRATVKGADSDNTATAVTRAIADSPLVKTAMHGGDANWGRVISSAGAALAGRQVSRACLHLGGVKVVEGSSARSLTDAEREKMLLAVKEPEIEISLDLGLGESSAEVYFSDLGHEYITINAEYHS